MNPSFSASQVLSALREAAFLWQPALSEWTPNSPFNALFDGGLAGFLQNIHPEDRPLVVPFFESSGPFEPVCVAFRRMGQDNLWFELTLDPILEGQQTLGLLGRIVPLEESAGHLKSILEQIPLALNMMTLQGEIRLMNRAQEEASQTSRADFVGRNVAEVRPHFAETFRKVFEDIQSTGETLPPQEYHTPDGRWWHSVHFPIWHQSGRLVAAGTVNLNITVQKEAEHQVQVQQRFLQKVTDGITATIQIRNLKTGKVTFRNGYASAVLGYTPEETLQMTVAEQMGLIPPEDLPRVLGLQNRIRELQDGASIEDEYRLKHKNGMWRWLFGRSTVFTRDADGSALESLTVSIDITERKEAELRLAESERRMQALLEGHNRFLGDAAHEIKTPIAGIQGNLEVLLRYSSIPEQEKQEILQDCHREAVRLGRLVSDLLTLTRAERGLLVLETEVHLDRLLYEVARDFETLRGNRTLKVDDPPACVTLGDRERLKQLLVILTENAIKYTPEGGTVTLGLEAEGERVLLKVSDTGIGIKSEDLPKVFERYFRSDHALLGGDPGGTGLGLPIAKWIVEGHGGEISLQSELGVGTEVVVSLPGHLE